jgi:hypothetical protein
VKVFVGAASSLRSSEQRSRHTGGLDHCLFHYLGSINGDKRLIQAKKEGTLPAGDPDLPSWVFIFDICGIFKIGSNDRGRACHCCGSDLGDHDWARWVSTKKRDRVGSYELIKPMRPVNSNHDNVVRHSRQFGL